MYRALKSLLFRLPPENAHQLTVQGLAATLSTPGVSEVFRARYRFEDKRLKCRVFDLPFSNPVGLAAGFDKDGKYYKDMSSLGFGFMELGTVTPRAQDGNPQPRMFRLPADRALINRMGFNNEGVDALASRLLRDGRPGKVILGGNIGKNKDTPNESATDDYVTCFEKLYPMVDYFVVNVSSPNTPNLRALQDREPLTALLSTLQDLNGKMSRPVRESRSGTPGRPGELWQRKPILLKIAPNLTEGQLDDILQIVEDTGIAGIIATNTTVARAPLRTDPELVREMGAGGLSGAPLRERATEVIRYLHDNGGDKLVIIGVGGIGDVDSAREKFAAGARLIQVYSGLVYAGPGLVKRIKKSLVAG